MATKVLDSWALIAFFEDEPAASTVEQLLIKAEAGTHRLLLCIVNWGEIYYTTMREVSQESAEKIAGEIANMPIELIGVETDLVLARLAAAFKARNKLSYADAFAAALAKLKNAELVTGDREFKALEGQIKIAWLGSDPPAE
ncbi:MAG: PIN domain-containing protein [Burkholderiales bacterium]|nr:PIN domain-containing protein [Burkholderiales bacterium]